MASPPPQPVLQPSPGAVLDFRRPQGAAQPAHRIAQRLTAGFQTGRVTLLGPGRGLPKPALTTQPHAAILESPVFLPIGLVRVAAVSISIMP